MNGQPARRVFRVRWWMWLLLALVLLLGAACVIRIQGFMRFHEVQREIAALGLPTDPVSFMAVAPPVDRDRQERLRPLISGWKTWAEKPGYLPFATPAEQRPSQKDLDAQADFLRLGRSDADRMAALLAEGPVVCSAYGFIDRDPAKLRHATVETLFRDGVPTNLLMARGYAQFWALDACQAADPAPMLLHLRRYAAAFDHPASLIDAMISIACSAIHSQGRLYLATRGRLPADDLEAWLGESDQHDRWMADAFAGERCLFWEPMARASAASAYASTATSVWPPTRTSWEDDGWIAYLLLVHGHESAIGAADLARTECTLRGLRWTTAVPSMPFGLPGLLTRYGLANTMECLVTAVEGRYWQRLRRVAGALAQAYRHGDPLPAAESEIPPHLRGLMVHHGPDDPAIRFERLSSARFRVGLDPAGPLPPSIPAGRWGPGYASTIGQPPSPKAWVDGRWSMEIDLDAILIPPPPPKNRPKPAVKPAP